MVINSIQEAELALQPFVPLVAQLTGKDTTLERIVPLMKLLGNPQDKLRVVHSAGTSGKTSTSYYIAGLLAAAGQKVGLTVSPHVDSITERVQLQGRPISEALFCNYLGSFLDIVAQAELQPSYFELLYAFAVWVFAQEAVDYAVIETGMGGLYDATNVVTKADKVCVITDIGYDHMHILGTSLAEIAAQKIGIAHAGNVVLMYQQSSEIMEVVTNWVKQQNATLQLTTQKEQQQLSGPLLTALPAFQQRNWLLAHYVFMYVQHRDSLPAVSAKNLLKTQSMQVPGRMEIVQRNGKTIIMDGAHNYQKMAAFLDSFRQLYPNQKPAFLLALKTGKDYERVVPLITAVAAEIIVTTFATTQDLPVKSMDPELLATALRQAGATQVTAMADSRTAFRQLLASAPKIVIISGSFYLLGQIRHNEGI